MADREALSIDKQIEQARTIKRLTANNSQLRSALKKCLGVLGGLDLSKEALTNALEAGRAALKSEKKGKS